MDLKDKNVVLTGASRGIGCHIARALAREGARVVISARTEAPLRQLADSITNLPGHAVAFSCDVTRNESREALIEFALRHFGPIDILINNAAIESEGPLTRLDAQTIDLTVATNFTAAVHLIRLVLPAMLQRRHGHIVNIGSVAGKKGGAYDVLYAGTKAALVEFSSALSAEVEDRGVGVSVVSPGYVSGEGMFAKFGVTPPWLLGTVTPEQVAEATLRAIRRNQLDVIVNRTPIRPLLAINALSPRLGNRVVKWMGVHDMQRRKVGG